MDIQRKAFEAEFRKTDFYKMNLVNCFCFINDRYVWDEVQAAWEMWQAAKAEAVPKWISVEEALPPGNILVLAMAQTFSNVFNVYNVMALDEFQESDITHWMPLPDAPREPTHDQS